MGGRYSSLEGVSIGGCPLYDPRQLTYVRTRVAKEAREDVAERPQLAAQVFQAENDRQGDLFPVG